MGSFQQAFLISAYKDPVQLVNLIERAKGFYVYVHIDKKNKRFFSEIINKYRDNPRVTILSKYKVSWGGYNHLRAIIFLMNLVQRNENVKYIHIISGQDYPIFRPNNGFARFVDSKTVYMSCKSLFDTNEGIIKRYQRKHFLALFLDLRGKLYYKLDKRFSFSQKRIGGVSINNLYKGMIWASMPLNVCFYVCSCVNKGVWKRFYRALKFCEIPEEVFFQTIIMNSEYKGDVVADNLRYTLWCEKNGSSPGILDESDYEDIINTQSIFARKVDSCISAKLIELLDNK